MECWNKVRKSNLVRAPFPIIPWFHYSNSPLFHRSIIPLPLLLHSEYLQNPLQFIVAEKGNLQSALSLGVAQVNFCAQPFAQSVLKPGHVRVLAQREGRIRLAARAA